MSFREITITMVSFCCVIGCKNNSISAKNVSYHEFPLERELRQKWLQAIGRPLWDPPGYIRICSEHFSVDQISHDGPIVQIKEEAYPINIPAKSFFEASNVEVCRICLATDVKMFSLQFGMLKVCIEMLTEFNDKYNKEGLPQFVCFECGAQLLKCYQLIEKSLMAHTTLLEILKDNGQITKHLVRLKDRKQLRLQSTLGYPKPGAVISIRNNHSESTSSLSDSIDSESEIDCANISLKRRRKEVKKGRRKNIDTKKPNKIRYKAVNDGSIMEEVIENKTLNHIDINITLKSETVENNEHYHIESLECNAENGIKSKRQNTLRNVDDLSEDFKQINETLKIEFENTDYKVEKFDSETEDFSDSLKIDLKTENSSHNDFNRFDSAIEETRNLNRVNKQINRILKPEESKLPDTVCIVNDTRDEHLSDESSESIDLLSLKNSVKLSHSRDRTSKRKTPARKKKKDDKAPPGESAIGKLTCYKVVNLSLEEQINEWLKENEQSIHTRDEVFTCEVCTKKFLRKKAYEQHLSYHKPTRGDVECPVCKERFQSKTRLNAHTTRTHAKRYECTKCPKVLYNLIRARRHEIQHSGQVYTCAHCAYSTRHRSAVWEHTRRQHPHAHHCVRCGHAFINAKGLAQHQAIAHPDQEEEPKIPFPCIQCNIVFHSEGALRVHQFTSKLHESQEEPAPVDQALKLTCKRCGATFAKRRELWAHAQKDHNWVSRPTLRKRGVPLDQRTCEHCDKEIKTRFEYWCHLRREHPNLKHTYRRVVTAVCDKCGKGFNNASLLKVHALSHGSATHACARCPRVFHDRHALARHAYSHTPDRPHACADCGRAFKLKGNLDRHMRTHTGETPYECSFCGKKFKYWSSMNEHEKHMHQKIPWPPRDRRTAAPKKGLDLGRM